jgi:spore coat polysaccharide biosynthesis protein SpsF
VPTAQGGLLVVVQARYESQRFPGKVLAPLLGQPMLLWELARLQQMRTPHTLVVACPDTEATHTQLVPALVPHGYIVELVEGDPNDVLRRFVVVAERYKAQEIVRICGDCPLIDPVVVDSLIAYYHWGMLPRPDHAGTGFRHPYWPDGMDCGIFPRETLRIADAEATLPHEREHVEPFMYEDPPRFHCTTLPCPFDLHAYQWSVDTPGDLHLVAQLLKHTLARVGFGFTWQDLWLTLELRPTLKQQCLARPARNGSYLAQVAAETGMAAQSWEPLAGKAAAVWRGAS